MKALKPSMPSGAPGLCWIYSGPKYLDAASKSFWLRRLFVEFQHGLLVGFEVGGLRRCREQAQATAINNLFMGFSFQARLMLASPA